MDIFILFFLILLNGMFAMSEIALVSAKKSRLYRLAEEQNDSAAKIALKLGEDPTKFLSTIQIGLTAIGVLNGIFGESILADPLSLQIASTFALEASLAKIIATTVTVIGITYITIVVGEIVPKRIGQFNAEGIARKVAKPIYFISVISRPFVKLLAWSTNMLLRLIGSKDNGSSDVTEDDITALLEEGSEAGVIEQQEHDMIKNVFRLDDRQIASLMVPRGDIVFIDLDNDLDSNLKIVSESNHSRFPVCKGGLQNILGVITAKALLMQLVGVSPRSKPDFTTHLQPAVYVPESLTGMELLHQFKQSGTQMVFVIDEYGEIKGIATNRDVLEAVTGEFKSVNPEDSWAIERENGSWLLDGLIPILELKDILGIKELPDEDKGKYQTLSGLVMLIMGKLPKEGDITRIGDWSLEVVDLDGKRIDKVIATCMSEDCNHQE